MSGTLLGARDSWARKKTLATLPDVAPRGRQTVVTLPTTNRMIAAELLPDAL